VTTTNYFNVEVMSVTVIGMMADTFFYPFGTKCLVGLKKEKKRDDGTEKHHRGITHAKVFAFGRAMLKNKPNANPTLI